MISAPDRAKAVELIDEARTAGARLKPACDVLNISIRTYQRWTKGGALKEDQRSLIKRTPQNKFTDEERRKVVEVINSQKYADLPPCKIVPALADQGEYIGSKSTIYRIKKGKNGRSSW